MIMHYIKKFIGTVTSDERVDTIYSELNNESKSTSKKIKRLNRELRRTERTFSIAKATGAYK